MLRRNPRHLDKVPFSSADALFRHDFTLLFENFHLLLMVRGRVSFIQRLLAKAYWPILITLFGVTPMSALSRERFFSFTMTRKGTLLFSHCSANCLKVKNTGPYPAAATGRPPGATPHAPPPRPPAPVARPRRPDHPPADAPARSHLHQGPHHHLGGDDTRG